MQRFRPPVMLEREWLLLGYLIYGALAANFIVFGAPSLDLSVFPGFARDVGTVAAGFVALGLYGAWTDRRYRFEAVGALGLACTLAWYFAAVLIVLIDDPDTGSRVAFMNSVFIITAVMWARGLSLLNRWIVDHRVAQAEAARRG